MDEFNVMLFDFNSKQIVKHNVIPYFIKCFDEAKDKSNIYSNLKNWIIKEAKYQFWSRCEYELIISGFPDTDHKHKIDVYYQVILNIEVIQNILREIFYKKLYHYTCSKCGSDNIEVKAWVDPNDNNKWINDVDEDERFWCNECDEFIKVNETNPTII